MSPAARREVRGRPHHATRTTLILLVAAPIIDAAFPAIVAAMDATAPGLDPWRHTLSRHVQAPGFPWMEVAFVMHGLAMAMLAIALRRVPPHPWSVPAALWIACAASFALAVLPADEATATTTRGALHLAVAPVAFMGVAVAGLLAWHARRREAAWQGLRRAPRLAALFLTAVLAFFGIFLAVVQFTDHPRNVLGATERLVVVGIAGWVLVEATQACRVVGRMAGQTTATG